MKTHIPQIVMIGSGLVLLGAGTYGIVPFKLTPRILWSAGILAAGCIALTILSLHLGGIQMVKEGLWHSVNVQGLYYPMLVFLMPVIGLSIPVTKHFQPLIIQSLSGPGSYLYALGAAFFAPPGNGFAGAVTTLWQTQPLQPVLLYFLTVVPLLSVPLYKIRVIGLGPDICAQVYLADISVAIFLIPYFWAYSKLMPYFVAHAKLFLK